MFNLVARPLLSASARPLARIATPSSTPLSRAFSQLSLTRPALPPTLPRPSALEQQHRTYKMPSCMKKKASPVSRNSGAGKTARKHSARRAKRRRQRAKKIN
ncbi:uncharacterized protein JCM15063_003794 [Sporobolomyces koalae]|uniref:uncharacterized protein n=1 Tax=Sporobolomyces koalae TaxID=500713 RepID=UPI0031825E6A